MRKSFLKYLTVLVLLLSVAPGCHTLDDDRVPVMPVMLTFTTVADWNIYGVAGALDYRRFIRDERVPANYPYTAASYTGYGGVLLVCDVLGNPAAFDLSCPVEHRRDVRVAINPDTHLAECELCGSAYDVFSLPGTPVDGPAARDGYGMRRYRVGPAQSGAYMMITN